MLEGNNASHTPRVHSTTSIYKEDGHPDVVSPDATTGVDFIGMYFIKFDDQSDSLYLVE